jgi:hypothetical protein
VTGEYIEGGRPKGDTSSYAVVEASEDGPTDAGDATAPSGRSSDPGDGSKDA